MRKRNKNGTSTRLQMKANIFKFLQKLFLRNAFLLRLQQVSRLVHVLSKVGVKFTMTCTEQRTILGCHHWWAALVGNRKVRYETVAGDWTNSVWKKGIFGGHWWTSMKRWACCTVQTFFVHDQRDLAEEILSNFVRRLEFTFVRIYSGNN